MIARLPLVLLAMDMKSLGAIGMIALVLVIALIARAAGGKSDGVQPMGDASRDPLPPIDAGEDDDRGEPDDDEFEAAEVVAVTSDGFALVPDAFAVRLVPPHDEGEAWKSGSTVRNRRGERALEMSWHAGDFTGARVVRGAADEGPWRFEAMGRDGEYTAFVFETKEGADAALELFRSRKVVSHFRDEDGREIPPSAEQFDEARRVYLETEAALEQGEDE